MPTDDVLHLLLARAGDNAPALPDGLPLDAATAPEALATPHQAQQPAAGPSAGVEPSPDDIPPARLWGLIIPEGPAGERLLALCARLIKAREAQQGEAAPVYRVPKRQGPMSLTDALAWRRECYDNGADLGYGRAAFQLILGDLDQVPLAIQQVQTMDAQVGRLFFADERGYEAYIDKVLRAEGAEPTGWGRVVLHTAHDGSQALDLGHAGLVTPGEALLRADLASGRFQASGILSHGEPAVPGKGVLIDHAAGPDPGVLFTMSHGIGLPPLGGGWRSPDEQRAGQGAMAFGITESLIGEELATGAFMPNGLWLMFACFGAGTPDASVYEHWLARIVARGRTPPDLRRALAVGRPFIAELPQRALANPDGPLAFVGHVDLAWTHSFRDADEPQQSHAGRFMRVLTSALAGETFGAAFQQLTTFVREADAALTSAYAADVPAAAAGDATAAAAAERKRALLWMRRQDLGGFILLGDPAAALPIGAPRKLAKGVPELSDSTGDALPEGTLRSGTLERAVLEVLLGDQRLEDIAVAHGLEPASLAQRAAQYGEAGRRAIGLDR